MKKTIFIKTFVTNIIVLAFFTIFTAIFTINTVRQWHIDSLVKELKKMSTIMTPEVNRYLNSNPDALDPHIKKLGKQIDNRLTVVKNDGTVFADSLSDPSKMENQGSRPEVIEAQTKDFSYNIRFSTTQMKEMLYFASPLKHEGTIAGVLRFSVFVDDINMILTRLNNKIIMLIIVLFVLSLLFTLFFSKRISDPIKRIAEASKEIKEGNFNTKVYVRDTGEIGNLANNFNSMVAYQKKLFTDLKKHQHELETILSSINEGLAVIDSDGNIVLSNQNFYKNIGNTKEKCQDKRIWEIYRAPNLNETIKNVFKQGEDTSEIIQIDDLFFRTSINLIKENNLMVITFHNITELKKVEQIKKDFVLNASHELKTPLTSIIGFIETLEQEIDEDNLKYLNIIKRNSERLANIVNDLLLINKLEDRDFSIKNEPVDLSEIVDETININKKAADIKELELIVEKPEEAIVMNGDQSKIEDMLINLVSNAIKYTDKGVVKVSYGQESDNQVFIKVDDTGIGIDKKNQDRIFERFYVVDKSRSREISGTGLGLSIVKHIVNLHNGSIQVDSDLDRGSTFTVTLPVK